MQIPPFVLLCKYGFWSHERTHSPYSYANNWTGIVQSCRTFRETLELNWAAFRIINRTDDETAGVEHIRFLRYKLVRLASIDKTYSSSSIIKYIYHIVKLDYCAKAVYLG